MTDDEFDALQADYDLCGVDGRLRDFAEAVQAACERAALSKITDVVSEEREACAKICEAELPADPFAPVTQHQAGQHQMAEYLATRMRKWST